MSSSYTSVPYPKHHSPGPELASKALYTHSKGSTMSVAYPSSTKFPQWPKERTFGILVMAIPRKRLSFETQSTPGIQEVFGIKRAAAPCLREFVTSIYPGFDRGRIRCHQLTGPGPKGFIRQPRNRSSPSTPLA